MGLSPSLLISNSLSHDLLLYTSSKHPTVLRGLTTSRVSVPYGSHIIKAEGEENMTFEVLPNKQIRLDRNLNTKYYELFQRSPTHFEVRRYRPSGYISVYYFEATRTTQVRTRYLEYHQVRLQHDIHFGQIRLSSKVLHDKFVLDTITNSWLIYSGSLFFSVKASNSNYYIKELEVGERVETFDEYFEASHLLGSLNPPAYNPAFFISI